MAMFIKNVDIQRLLDYSHNRKNTALSKNHKL